MAAALAASAAIDCAAGLPRRTELLRWLHLSSGRPASQPTQLNLPLVPASALAWLRAARAALDLDGHYAGYRSLDQSHHATDHLRRRGVAALARLVPDGSRPQYLRALSRYPDVGLSYVELAGWPDDALCAFPPLTAPTDARARWAEWAALAGEADLHPDVRLSLLVLAERFSGADSQPPAALRGLLLAGLRDARPAARGLSLRAIAASSGMQNPPLGRRRFARLIGDPVAAVRAEAARAAGVLQRVNASVVAGLAALLRDHATDVRRHAAEAVAALGQRTATTAILEALSTAVNAPDAALAVAAARAAAAVARRMTRPLRSALVGQLSHADGPARAAALRALGRGGTRCTRVSRAIVARMRDEFAPARREAVVAFRLVRSPDDTPPTTRIALLLLDEYAEVREAAAELVYAVGRGVLCGRVCAGVAHVILTDGCAPAFRAAERLGQDRTEIVEAAFARLLRGNPDAARTLHRLGRATQTAGRLTAILSGPDRVASANLVGAMKHLRDAACWPELLDDLAGLLGHENAEVRATAAVAAQSLGRAAACDALVSGLILLRADGSALVRLCAEDALKVLQLQAEE